MITTILELRQAIADGCDNTQPLRIVAHDVGKKASKHSVVRVDENHPAKMAASAGLYTDKAIIELSYDADAGPLMPEDAIAALDELLEEKPKERIGWVYFFYFPLDLTTFFGKVRRIACSLLDTSEVLDLYLSEEEPNTLVIKAKYGLGSFD